MDKLTPAFEWGVFLFCVGAIALIVLTVIRILIGKLVRMARRLQPTMGTVREDDRAVAGMVGQVMGPAFRAPFRFDYEVAGKRYTGSLTTLQVDNAAKVAASAALAARHPGETITVYYDRDHPARSVMVNVPPTVPAWVRIGLVVVAVVAVAGLVLAATG